MSCLPTHGRVACSLCYDQEIEFDHTRAESDEWRITANPLAWGNDRPEILVLGFSKGPNALGALATQSHNEIPYASQRLAVAKILAHVGLIQSGTSDEMRRSVDRAIADCSGRFAWGSLIRCTVQRRKGTDWKGSGGGMLDRFIATSFGQRVVGNCVHQHLGDLPIETKLVVLFGLGTKLGYVRAARQLIKSRSASSLRTVNEVAYADDYVTFVHVEHFAAQGHLIPDWLGIPNKRREISDRSRWGRMAQDAIRERLTR